MQGAATRRCDGEHRRGAATPQTPRCRRNPQGRRDFWPQALSQVANDALRCIASSVLLACGQNRWRRSPAWVLR